MRHIEAEIQSIPKLEIDIGPVSVLADAPAYIGAYEAVPKAHTETTLETAGKLLTKNVRILEIPYFEVSNETGNTVYIGRESEIL